MKKQHKFLTILLIIIMCVTILTALVACDNPGSSNDEVKDTSKIIANGNFEVTTSDTFPKTPGSWTASPGSTSSGNETDADDKSLVAGVIDTESSVYEKNKKYWGRLKNPGKATNAKDNNILMIYNKVDNSYKYTSSNFTLDTNKIYQIDVSVKTILTGSSWGAYIKISGDAFIEFPEINTNGEWLTYSAMVKTSNTSSNSLNVVLSNGKDGKKDNMLSNGHVFFDNVVVTEITDDDAENKFNDFKNASKSDLTKGFNDLTYGDTSFINISGTKNPFTARKWTGVSSSGDNGENAPTGSDYLERGVVDLKQGNIPTPADGLPLLQDKITDRLIDSKMLMINNKQSTAYAYRSDNKIKIEGGEDKYYKISVWVLTKIEDAEKGAYIMIKSTTDKSESIKTVDKINTQGDWQQYHIIVKADSKRTKEIYLQLGLGTGGKDDDAKNIKGTVFFDEITIEEATDLSDNDKNNAASLESTIGNEIPFDTAPNDHKNYEEGYYDLKFDVPSDYHGDINSENGIVTIKNDLNGITRYIYNGKIEIKPNSHYRFSFKVKTDLIHEDKGIDIKFYKKNDTNKQNNRYDIELTNATITNFNTENVDDNNLDKDKFTEFTFLFQGDLQDTTYVYFEIIMGSGTNLTPDKLIKGSTSLKDFELFNVYYADYNSESGTYVKKHSFQEESDTSITNGNFNKIDIAATKTQYENENKDNDNTDNKEFDEKDFLEDNTNGIFGLPQNWTTSDKDILKDLYAGVFNANNDKQKELLDVKNLNIAKDLQDLSGEKNNTNLLVISSKKAEGQTIESSWGFTSPSISVSKGKYYQISVWARATERDTVATINLLSSSKTLIQSFDVQGVDEGWQEYIFFIKAGFDNSSVHLELKLGNENDSSSQGTVFFDSAKLIELQEDQYETRIKEIEANKNYRKASTFSTISFDNVTANSEEGLDSADGWTGSHSDTDSPSGEGKSIAGVYNRNHSDRNWFGKQDEDGEGEKAIGEDVLIDIMNKVPDPKDESKIEGDKNNNILVINNTVASEYTLTTTLAENSLTENKYYEISLWVLTYNVASDKTAKLQLKLHNSTYSFAKDENKGINVNTNGVWKKYSYFIATQENADIDNVELSISLGTSGKDNYVQGYLFIDNVTIIEIDETRFNNEVPEDYFPKNSEEADKFEYTDEIRKITNNKQRIVFTADDLNKDPEEESTNKPDPLLWLYITSGIIGGLIVIVVIVFLLRKFNVFAKFSKKNNFAEKGTESYNRNRVESNKANAQNRDINKKHQD